jgi:pyridoxal phosphate enzyme (YggS family)
MIAENLNHILDQLPQNVQLIAVSKTYGVDAIMQAYQQGQRRFGENKVQELVAKEEELPKDIEWHLIGHLQTNKVKYIASFVHTIHAVDSAKLLNEINKRAVEANRIINCLLQFHIAEEDTKFGLQTSEPEFLKSGEYQTLNNVRICGVMGMATFTEDKGQIRNEFKKLNSIYHQLKQHYFSDADYFKHISMGMSSDYSIAIEEGSTMIRVGSNIFGQRN